MRRLQIVGGGVRVRGVVVIRIELDTRDVFLEGSDRDRAGELLTPSPDQIKPAAEHGGEGVNVLVPRAVEVAEEEQIVVLQLFRPLSFAEAWERSAWNDHPPGKLDKGKIDQIALQWLDVPQHKEHGAQDPGLPRLHGSDNVERVYLPVDVAHGTSRSKAGMANRPKTSNFKSANERCFSDNAGERSANYPIVHDRLTRSCRYFPVSPSRPTLDSFGEGWAVRPF